MKYALTGHTSGIGKAIYDKLSPSDCKGFSRYTGYDITVLYNRQMIIEQCNECSVFINNAHASWGQVELLIDLLRVWLDKPKQIINIGSFAAHTEIPVHRQELLTYAAQKSALYNVVTNSQKYRCKVDYVQWSYVGTERILRKYPNLAEYLPVENAVNDVLGLIEK